MDQISGCCGKCTTDTDLAKSVCENGWPPAGSQVQQAAQAAALLSAKDAPCPQPTLRWVAISHTTGEMTIAMLHHVGDGVCCCVTGKLPHAERKKRARRVVAFTASFWSRRNGCYWRHEGAGYWQRDAANRRTLSHRKGSLYFWLCNGSTKRVPCIRRSACQHQIDRHPERKRFARCDRLTLSCPRPISLLRL